MPSAHADIYTWVDASGTINVSNLPPPEGAKVTNIVRERAPEVLAREDAAREAARLAETQALAERVRQLEEQVAFGARPAPPADYRLAPPPASAPTIVQYFVDASPPATDYPVSAPPPPYDPYNWCDPTWYGCGFMPGFYPASVVVVSAPNGRRIRPAPHGSSFGPHSPMRPPLVPPLATPIVQPLLPQRASEGFRRG